MYLDNEEQAQKYIYCIKSSLGQAYLTIQKTVFQYPIADSLNYNPKDHQITFKQFPSGKMTVIKTTVAKSHDVKDAALNLNVKAYEVRRTLAAVWSLQSTRAQPPAPEATFSLDMKNESSESVIGDDQRVLVDKNHFAPGGKYRCKLTKWFSSLHAHFFLRSNCKTLHTLRIPESRRLGNGYRLAYQA